MYGCIIMCKYIHYCDLFGCLVNVRCECALRKPESYPAIKHV